MTIMSFARSFNAYGVQRLTLQARLHLSGLAFPDAAERSQSLAGMVASLDESR